MRELQVFTQRTHGVRNDGVWNVRARAVDGAVAGHGVRRRIGAPHHGESAGEGDAAPREVHVLHPLLAYSENRQHSQKGISTNFTP